MDKQTIKEIVQETIEELKRGGVLRTENEFSYDEISAVLFCFAIYNALQ